MSDDARRRLLGKDVFESMQVRVLNDFAERLFRCDRLRDENANFLMGFAKRNAFAHEFLRQIDRHQKFIVGRELRDLGVKLHRGVGAGECA